MDPFQKLLQSIGASGIKRVSGLIDDVVRPRLLVDSQRPIQKSAGVLSRDILERLRFTNKYQQKYQLLHEPIGDFKTDSFSKGQVFPSSPRPVFTPPVFNESGVYPNLNPTQRFLQQYAPIERSVGTSVADNYVPIQRGGLFNRLNSMVMGKPFLSDLPEYGSKLSSGVANRAGGGMQNVAEALLPKQAFNSVGGVGGLIQNLNKVTTPMGVVKMGLKIGGPLGGLIDSAQTAYKGSVQQNQLGGLLSPAGAAYGAARMLTGGPFSLLPSIVDNMDKIMPRTSNKDLLQEYANIKARDQEFKTNRTDAGRYIPGNQQKPIFVKQADAPPRPDLPPADPGLTQAGTLNTGAGTLDQRRAIEERNYRTQLNNAKQQYATPDPMSPDFQGYPNELAARYGLEQAYGQELRQAGTLVPQLQEAGAGAGMTPENFAAWAKANPGLAVRLLSQGQRN